MLWAGVLSAGAVTFLQVAMSQGSLHLQLAGAGLLFGAFLLPVFTKRSRLPAALMMLSVLLGIFPIAGCGGGSSTKSPAAQSAAPSTYQLVVTATSGNANAMQKLTLIVK
jgi:hypothetical protein